QAMAAAIVIALIFIVLGAKPIGKGLILGTLFSVLNFVLMAHMLPLRMQETRRKSIVGAFGSIWVRLALLALPLLIALKIDSINFFAAAAGLFMVQIIIVLNQVPDTFKSMRSGRRRAV
ncbi:MAG: ATP synthase subunit I, partial [Desulfosarcinaceae bacterium]